MPRASHSVLPPPAPVLWRERAWGRGLGQPGHHVAKAWPGLNGWGRGRGSVALAEKSRAASAAAAWGPAPLPGPPPCPLQPSGVGPDGSRWPQPGSEEKAKAAAATVFSGQGCTGSSCPRGGSAHTCHRHTSARLSQDPQASLRPIWDLAKSSEQLAYSCPGVCLPRSGASSPSLQLHAPRPTL